MKRTHMKKTFLLVCFLFLLAGLKAQEAKSKKPDIIEYREGSSPELKAQQKPVKNETQVVPKPLDSIRSSAKMKSAIGNQTIPKRIDSVSFKSNSNRFKTSDKKVDSVTQFIKEKVATKKTQQTTANKPAAQQAANRGE